jgi:hypothetical protein
MITGCRPPLLATSLCRPSLFDAPSIITTLARYFPCGWRHRIRCDLRIIDSTRLKMVPQLFNCGLSLPIAAVRQKPSFTVALLAGAPFFTAAFNINFT